LSQLTVPIGSHGAVVPILVLPSGDDLWSLELEGKRSPPLQRILALADTGASQTCLHPSVLEALDLSSLGPVGITTPSTGAAPETRDRYKVALVIPARLLGEPPLVFDTLEVVSTELHEAYGVQALLGRDVLEQCLLVYHGPERQFTLAY